MARPQKCITEQEARTLYTNWQTTRGASLATQGEPDHSDFTWSLDELQEFLDYVREESEKQGVKNPGVRAYFAAYDNQDSKKATVFLAPTKGGKGDSENNYSVDPFNFGQGGWPPNIY